jgi:UDP-N-acetylglucosamine:LPS N-acetylglucosamine transferase
MKKDLNDIVMFASNDGGHFAEMAALKELFSKYDSVILTDNKRANKSIPGFEHVKAIEFAMAFADRRDKLKKSKKKSITVWDYATCYFKLFWECNNAFKKYRPKIIISAGSNISVPLCFIAKLHGTKFIHIENKAKVYSKTISGRIIESFVDKMIVQWPEMIDVYEGKADYYGVLF